MPDDARNLPVETETLPSLQPATMLVLAGMPLGLQIFFEPSLNAYCKDAARYMAGAQGFVPKHLLGKPQACFAVVSRSLTWRLDPFAVAQATYETPDGKVGYMGSLIQAILEQSGRLDGGVKFRHEGDWDRLRGKFKMAVGKNGGEYPVPAWVQFGPEEEGLQVVVTAKLKDEDERREMVFSMKQAYPRFSTLWAVDPATQIQYTAVRRFASTVVPTLLMGVSFDREEAEGWANTLRDVTPPRPQLDDFTQTPAPRRRRAAAAVEPDPSTEEHPGTSSMADPGASSMADPGADQDVTGFFFADQDGEVHEYAEWQQAVAAYAEILEAARTEAELAAAWENGAQLLSRLRESDHDGPADALGKQYSEMLAALQPEPAAAAADQTAKAEAADDVLVPYAGGGSTQEWFYTARDKLKKQMAGKPPAEFARFRQANATTISQLGKEFPSWRKILDKLLDEEIAKGNR